MPDFEVFNRKSAVMTKEPMVTIQKGGMISLNAAAFEMLRGDGEGEELPVELLYDADSRVIGLRAVSGGPNVYVIRKQANSRSYLVAGRAFTRHYGIDTSVARRYGARMYGDVLGVDLNDEFSRVGRKRD